MNLQDKYPGPDLPPSRDPGEWYRNKAREADHWFRALELARAAGAPLEDIRYLERLLEGARYVGD